MRADPNNPLDTIDNTMSVQDHKLNQPNKIIVAVAVAIDIREDPSPKHDGGFSAWAWSASVNVRMDKNHDTVYIDFPF